VLLLQFQLDADRYAIDAACIAGVLPLIEITRIPQAPPALLGVCDCRGKPVPVIDLSQLLAGRPAERRLSTRLLIVRYKDDTGKDRRLGLVAEQATGFIRREASSFVPSGISNPRAPYLGDVAGDAHGLVQRIDVNAVLPPDVRELLFRQEVAS
jgi:chemotaxis-related protein WspB